MKEMHLKPGDPLTIIREANNSLSIIPYAERSSNLVNEATAIVLYHDGVNSLKRKIVSIYLAGYNTMHLKSKTGRISPAQRDAMSHLSLGALSDAVEAFLRRDYVMADSVVDKVENIRSVEND
jgi:hypothetical protein